MTEPVFVGRESELARLQAYLDKVLAGQGQVAFLTGEPGAGKTTLAREFARRAQEKHPDLLYVIGECNAQTGVTDAFLPFKEILGTLLGNVEQRVKEGSLTSQDADRLKKAVARAAELLVEVGPMLIMLFGGMPAMIAASAGQALLRKKGWLDQLNRFSQWQKKKGSGQVPQFEQASDPAQIFEQYTQVLLGVTQEYPLIVILDDLQWADPSSIDLLFHLGRKVATGHLLILGTYRPQDVALGRGGQRHPLEKVLHELQRYQGQRAVSLDVPAHSEEGRRFVHDYLERNYSPQAFDASFVDSLVERTEGNPLFLSELLENLTLQSAIEQDVQGVWRALPSLRISDLPPRIDAVIAERLARLEPELRDLLQAGSVQGETFTAQILARVRGMEELSLIRHLTEDLERRHGLIRSLGASSEHGVRLYPYRFEHSLIQQYLYHQLAAPEREILHAQTGHALEELYQEDPSAAAQSLAHHFSRAHLEQKALSYSVQAADQQLASYAYAEALALYDQALEFGTPLKDAQSLPLLQRAFEGRGRTLLAKGDLAAVRANYERMVELSRQRAWLPMQMAAYNLRADFISTYAGDFAEAAALLEEALQQARAAGGDRLTAQTLINMSRLLAERGQFDEAQERLEQATVLSHSLGEPALMARILAEKAVQRQALCDFELALQYGQQVANLARQVGAQEALAEMLLMLLSISSAFLGRLEAAESHVEEANSIVQKIGFLPLHPLSRAFRAEVKAARGDFQTVFSDLEEAIQLSQQLGLRSFLGYAAASLGFVYASLGDLERALSMHQRAMEEYNKPGGAHFKAWVLARRGLCHLERGEPDAALPFLQEVLTAGSLGAHMVRPMVLRGLAWAHLQRGDHAEASLYLEQALALASSHKMVLEEAEALLLRAQMPGGDRYPALEDVNRAIQLAQPSPLILWRAYALLGQLQRNLGDTEGSQRSLSLARGIVDNIAETIPDPQLRETFQKASWARTLIEQGI